jgi:predicted nucleic acid-binding protein
LKRVVADASAMAAVIFLEPGFESVAARLEGATVCAPELLRFELANVAVTKARRHPALAGQILAALDEGLDRRSRIQWHPVNVTDVAMLGRLTHLTAYDAAYLWLAGWLEADLVTLDKRLMAAAQPDSETVD